MDDTIFAQMSRRITALERSQSNPHNDYREITGWIPYAYTWTYASATTFTIATDVTVYFPVGTKIKLTQTTVKYFYVLSAVYGAPNTTITITGGSDYSLANAAITSPYYSYAVTPQEFPNEFNYTPTWSCTGTNVVLGSGTLAGKFSMQGRLVHASVSMSMAANTTFGNNYWRWLLPTSPIGLFNKGLGSCRMLDNGTVHRIGICETNTVTAVDYCNAMADSAGNYISAAVPFTWANTDELYWSVVYLV